MYSWLGDRGAPLLCRRGRMRARARVNICDIGQGGTSSLSSGPLSCRWNSHPSMPSMNTFSPFCTWGSEGGSEWVIEGDGGVIDVERGG